MKVWNSFIFTGPFPQPAKFGQGVARGEVSHAPPAGHESALVDVGDDADESHWETIDNTGAVQKLSQGTIDTNELPAYKTTAIERIRETCKVRIHAEWPPEIQSSFALGAYTDRVQKEQMLIDITETVEASNVVQAAIELAADHAAVDAAVAAVVWPTYPATAT